MPSSQLKQKKEHMHQEFSPKVLKAHAILAVLSNTLINEFCRLEEKNTKVNRKECIAIFGKFYNTFETTIDEEVVHFGLMDIYSKQLGILKEIEKPENQLDPIIWSKLKQEFNKVIVSSKTHFIYLGIFNCK